MAVFSGTNIVNDGLVFHLDASNFTKNNNKTQLISDPFFRGDSPSFINGSSYRNANHLGEIPLGEMTGRSVIFSGGDTANYSVSRPEIWGVDRGSIGATGGNWRYYSILDDTLNANVLYVIRVRWRFYYVSKTGAGTTNPSFQIGVNYTSRYTRSYSQVGDGWIEDSFIIDGTEVVRERKELTFSCTSADSAIEMSKLECYKIERTNFYSDLASKKTITAFNGIEYSDTVNSIVFDGSNDYLKSSNFDISTIQEDFTFSAWLKFSSIPYTNPRILHYSTDSNNTWHFGAYGGANPSVLSYFWIERRKNGIHYGNMDYSFKYEAGKWYYLVGTFDDSANQPKLYINGELSPTYSGINGGPAPTNNELYIGSSQLNGEIDQVKIYSKVLTEAEIKQNFEATRSRYGI